MARQSSAVPAGLVCSQPVSKAADVGAAVLARVRELELEVERLNRVVGEKHSKLERAEQAYSDLAQLLGTRLELSEESDLGRLGRVVRAEFTVDEELVHSPGWRRRAVLDSIGRTLGDALLVKLARADGEAADLRRVPIPTPLGRPLG
jgi:hypothetical protein